jgi:curved DNA-binding protein
VPLVDNKDHYQTLGVPVDASEQDIKKAYRKLMRKHHPDLNRAHDAGAMAKAINQAYAVLGDPAQRAAYDAARRGARPGRPSQAQPAWDAGDDFFADLFGGGRSKRPGAPFRLRGDDIHASVAVDLADAYHGARRSVSLRLPQQRERSVEVSIPQGVVAGQVVHVAGQGHPGLGGGPPGDLLLEIQFASDPRYRIALRDVFQRLPVAPWEAALGALIDVDTPSGQVLVSVPPGSQGGRKLRLKGRGIPGHPPGDLFLELDVVLPPASSDKARALYQTMARELAFNPRAGLRV